jgi:hypothetical protein
MDARTIDSYLARAAAATTVRDLHATVRTLRRAHPADADAEDVERACWQRALALFRQQRSAAAPPAPPRRAPADWKAQAAQMEPA